MDSKDKIQKENRFGEHLQFWIGSIISSEESEEQKKLVSGRSWGYQYQVAIFGHYSTADSQQVERIGIAQVLLPPTAGSGAAGRLESVKLSAGDRVFGAFFGPDQTIPVILGIYTRTQYTVYGTGKFQPKTGFEGKLNNINDLLERQEFSGTLLPGTPQVVKKIKKGRGTTRVTPDTSQLKPDGSVQVFDKLSDDNK